MQKKAITEINIYNFEFIGKVDQRIRFTEKKAKELDVDNFLEIFFKNMIWARVILFFLTNDAL